VTGSVSRFLETFILNASPTRKSYRGTSYAGKTMATQENNGFKRAHYDMYVDEKMPRDRHKKPRLCSGNMTLRNW
jgi:hypothetical protein